MFRVVTIDEITSNPQRQFPFIYTSFEKPSDRHLDPHNFPEHRSHLIFGYSSFTKHTGYLTTYITYDASYVRYEIDI